ARHQPRAWSQCRRRPAHRLARVGVVSPGAAGGRGRARAARAVVSRRKRARLSLARVRRPPSDPPLRRGLEEPALVGEHAGDRSASGCGLEQRSYLVVVVVGGAAVVAGGAALTSVTMSCSWRQLPGGLVEIQPRSMIGPGWVVETTIVTVAVAPGASEPSAQTIVGLPLHVPWLG